MRRELLSECRNVTQFSHKFGLAPKRNILNQERAVDENGKEELNWMGEMKIFGGTLN